MKCLPSFSTLELTVALIKPHATKVPYIVKDITEIIRQNGFYIVQHNKCVMDFELAGAMYEEHKGKSFYNRLVGMISSGPLNAFVLARENAILKWRELMGPTRALETQFTHPTTLRGMYGLSNTRNATHGSDSPSSVFKETAMFFPSFDIFKWYENEEEYFRNGYVKFCEKSGRHIKDENATKASKIS